MTIHWPRPQIIRSEGQDALGYHDRLVLPIQIQPQDASQPIHLQGTVDFGLCHDICVPAHIALSAGPAMPDSDPAILAALDRQPERATSQPLCQVDEIADGMRIALSLPADADADIAAIELSDSTIWSSSTVIEGGAGTKTAWAEFVDTSGKPFAIDPQDIRLTLIKGASAVEYQGCQVAG